MGQLIEGVWSGRHLPPSKDGRFVRAATQFRNWITPDGGPGPTGEGGFRAEPGRYHLYVSLACPWAHRTLIMRRLKGLEDAIGVSVVHWLLAGQGGNVYRAQLDQVTIGTVQEGPFEDYIAVRGAVAPFITAYLTTDQGGTVKQVLVEDGAKVKAGQALIVLSNPALQLQVAAQQLTFEGAQIRFEDASITKRALDYAGSKQNVSGQQMADSLKAMTPIMLAQLNIPELQNAISAAVSTFLDDPKSLTVKATPDKPVAFPMILGAAMGAPNTVPQMLSVKVSAND